jgi:hypothetical protein
MTYETKPSMLARGKDLIARFCAANGLELPAVEEADPKGWPFGVCAYYRRGLITINVQACASIGFAGMQWSFPGHSVDRTPYGVLAHELGHHVDLVSAIAKRGPYYSDYSIAMRARVGEAPLTSYCPNDAEWFAEMFRLFVTNPDLLRSLRPLTYAAIAERFKPVFEDAWRERLAGAPDRTILSIERKLEPKPAKRQRAPKAAPGGQLDLMGPASS